MSWRISGENSTKFKLKYKLKKWRCKEFCHSFQSSKWWLINCQPKWIFFAQHGNIPFVIKNANYFKRIVTKSVLVSVSYNSGDSNTESRMYKTGAVWWNQKSMLIRGSFVTHASINNWCLVISTFNDKNVCLLLNSRRMKDVSENYWYAQMYEIKR